MTAREETDSSTCVREEKWLLGLLLLVAVGLRLWHVSDSAVEHFDEGVYASNFWFNAEEGYRYPDRHLYAPPLLPALIEWGHFFVGPGIWACLGPSLLAGIALIPLAWWGIRPWAGPRGALCAACLLSFLDFSILYSRTALTESLLCFWMLLSVMLACRALNRVVFQKDWSSGVWLQAAFSGLCAGLAWLTKYNGWLSLAIIVSGSLAWGVMGCLTARQWSRVAVLLLLIVGVAGLVWLPYWQSLEPLGGYASVAANHRRYFVGLAGWGESLVRQLSNFWQLSGISSLCGLLGAVWLACFALKQSTSKSTQVEATKEESTFATDPAVSRYSVRQLWRCESALLGWLLASWAIGLSLATPLYHPYPRLLMPWLTVVCLVIGLSLPAVCRWVGGRCCNRFWDSFCVSRSGGAGSWKVCAGGLLLLTLVASAGPLSQAPAWQDRRGLQRVANQFIETAGQQAAAAGRPVNEVIFYVYGEPAVFYHLSAGQRIAGPIGHLDFADPVLGPVKAPTFLVTGPHAADSELFRQQWDKWGARFELVEQATYQPSRFVELNQGTGKRQESLALYRLKEFP